LLYPGLVGLAQRVGQEEGLRVDPGDKDPLCAVHTA